MGLNPSFESVAQTAHVGIGAFLVLAPAVVCIHHPAFLWGHPQIVGSFVGFVWAAVKEFSWDQNMEDAITRGSNWKDFAFYMGGVLMANIILWV